MSHIWMSPVTHMNESCDTHEWVTSYTWLRLVTFIGKVVNICLGFSVNLVYKFKGKPGTTSVKPDFNNLGLKFHRGSQWVSVLSWLNLKENKDYFSCEHTWRSHYTHMNESCHTHERLTSYTWMSRVTHVNDSCHIHQRVMSHIWTSHVTQMNESCHIYEWVMSHI